MPTTKNESNGKEVRVMPRRDGTGPIGMGSMTGRGAGFCTNRMNNQGLKKLRWIWKSKRMQKRIRINRFIWLFKK